MKKLIIGGLILIFLSGLVGCGKENGNDTSKKTATTPTVSSHAETLPTESETPKQDMPSEKMIFDDLIASLANENEYAEISETKLVKSLKEDNTYTATFTVLAASKYADWEYEAEMEYTKYDQGWMVDNVVWNDGTYEQVRLPSVDDMVEYASNYLLAHEVYSDVWFTEYLVPMQSPTLNFCLNATVNEEVLEFYWEGTEHLLHADVSHDFTSLWHYDPQIDNWTLYPNDSSGSLGFYVSESTGNLTPNYDLDFSGEWNDIWHIRYLEVPLKINISNFSWENFDAEITWDSYNYYKNDVVGSRTASGHFTRTDHLPSEYALYASGDCIFTDGNGGYITFSFESTYTSIHYIAQGCETYIRVSISDSLPTLQ